MHTARFTLQSDVSQCYASIYTHSLSWALHGKKTAKAHIGDMSLYGNVLDKAVREGQSGQTKGLPIGPDTSLALAEVILCAIDLELKEKVPTLDSCGLRYLDDVEIFTRTRGEAEGALLAWESALGRYELLINPEKTLIAEGPVGLDSSWRTRLRQFAIRMDTDRKAANDIVAFFDLAFELAREVPREAVISWAIQRFRDFTFGDESWRAFSDLMLPAAIAEPSSLRYVSQALAEGRAAGRKPSRERLAMTMNALVEHHAPLEHGAEVAWALWILAENGGALDKGAGQAVAGMSDNASLIALRHLGDKGLVKIGDLDLTTAESSCHAPDALASSDWLLAYESARHGWTSDATVQSDSFFKRLLKLGVKFFDPDGVAPVSAPAPSPSGASLADESPPGSESEAEASDDETKTPDSGTDSSSTDTETDKPSDAPVSSPSPSDDDDDDESPVVVPEADEPSDDEPVAPVPIVDSEY
jgi:hypothetical protein